MSLHREVSRFGLYGEGPGSVEPEFAHIETISDRSGLHNWSIAPHLHPAIAQLLFLAEGEGWVGRDGKEEPLVPPCLVVVPCGCPHAFHFTPHARGWVLSISDQLFADQRLAALDFEPIVRGTQVLPIEMPVNSRRSALLGTLLDEFHHRHGEATGQMAGSDMALLALVLATCTEAATGHGQEPARQHNRRLALVRRFTRLVEQRYAEHWPVERYAAELGTTVPTLTRACREVTGRPPGRIALDRVLREAMRSLSFTTASISEISDALGFSDPAYFARIFRKHSGMTASAFRRERVWLTDKNGAVRN